MFIPKFFPFLSLIEDDDTAGDSNTDQGDNVQPVVENEPNDYNPAWNDALSAVPEEFHPHLKEHFSKTDKYTQEVQQRFAPFKEFAESNTRPEDIKEALQFAHFLNTNPRGVFDFLDKQYNYTNPGNANQSQGVPAKQEDEIDVNDPFANADLSKNPQFAQIAQQNQQLINQFEAQEQQKLEARMDAQIQSEVEAIKTTYPDLDPREVITRAMGKNAAGITKDIDLNAAAKELAEMFKVPATQPGSSAPPVLGRSSLPSTAVRPGSMSREDRTKYVADQIRALNEGS